MKQSTVIIAVVCSALLIQGCAQDKAELCAIQEQVVYADRQETFAELVVYKNAHYSYTCRNIGGGMTNPISATNTGDLPANLFSMLSSSIDSTNAFVLTNGRPTYIFPTNVSIADGHPSGVIEVLTMMHESHKPFSLGNGTQK